MITVVLNVNSNNEEPLVEVLHNADFWKYDAFNRLNIFKYIQGDAVVVATYEPGKWVGVSYTSRGSIPVENVVETITRIENDMLDPFEDPKEWGKRHFYPLLETMQEYVNEAETKAGVPPTKFRVTRNSKGLIEIDGKPLNRNNGEYLREYVEGKWL